VLAWPLALTGADPSVVGPSLNVTRPVGTPGPLTVAVNVTAAPKVDGFRLDATCVVLEPPTSSIIDALWTRLPLAPVMVMV